MMFSRPSNIYLVHGWRVDESLRNSMMMDKGEIAKEGGITLTISDNGKEWFVGRHLGTVEIREGQASAKIIPPSPEDEKSLEEAARELDLGVTGRPQLFVVAG